MKNLKLQYIFTLSVTVLYLCCFLLTSLEHQWALWIQPSISADLGRHGFAWKAMPMWEVWWRRWVGGHLGAVPDSLTDFWVASMKTFDLLEFTCLFNRPGTFNICSHLYAHEKQKDCIFHKLPCCLGYYMSHMLRSFLRQMPRCSQRDAANMTDGQHRDRTDQDMCLGSTQKCLCAHKYRIDDARSVSCKVCKCLERGPLKMCPRWINTGRWQFLSPSHILEGRCCELHWLRHSHYLPEIHSYMHPHRYIYKVINIRLHTPTCTCTPHIYVFIYPAI